MEGRATAEVDELFSRVMALERQFAELHKAMARVQRSEGRQETTQPELCPVGTASVQLVPNRDEMRGVRGNPIIRGMYGEAVSLGVRGYWPDESVSATGRYVHLGGPEGEYAFRASQLIPSLVGYNVPFFMPQGPMDRAVTNEYRAMCDWQAANHSSSAVFVFPSVHLESSRVETGAPMHLAALAQLMTLLGAGHANVFTVLYDAQLNSMLRSDVPDIDNVFGRMARTSERQLHTAVYTRLELLLEAYEQYLVTVMPGGPPRTYSRLLGPMFANSFQRRVFIEALGTLLHEGASVRSRVPLKQRLAMFFTVFSTPVDEAVGTDTPLHASLDRDDYSLDVIMVLRGAFLAGLCSSLHPSDLLEYLPNWQGELRTLSKTLVMLKMDERDADVPHHSRLISGLCAALAPLQTPEPPAAPPVCDDPAPAAEAQGAEAARAPSAESPPVPTPTPTD